MKQNQQKKVDNHLFLWILKLDNIYDFSFLKWQLIIIFSSISVRSSNLDIPITIYNQ